MGKDIDKDMDKGIDKGGDQGDYPLWKMDLAGKVLLFGVAIGLVAAAWAVAARYRSEALNRTVELVVDFPDANQVARSDGEPVLSVLEGFRTAGVGSLGVTEFTLEHRIRDGSVRAAAGRELLEARALSAPVEPGFAELVRTRRVFPTHTYLTLPVAVGEPAGTMPGPGLTAGRYFDFIARAVQIRLRGEVAATRYHAGGWPVVDIARDPADLTDLELGPSDREIALARHAGLKVVPRFSNFASMTPEKFGFFLEQIPRESRLVIFSGKEVAGAPHYVGEVAAELAHRRMLFGMVEFADQAGEKALAKDLRLRVVRVHSITPKEMRVLSRRAAVERLVRAVRERNIRVLYLRLFPVRPGGELAGEMAEFPAAGIGGSGGGLDAAGPESGEAVQQAWLGGKGPHGSLTEYNVSYIVEVVDGLKWAGYHIGQAGVFKGFRIPLWAWLAMAAGALAGGLLLVRRFVIVPAGWLLGLYGLGLLGSAILLWSGRGILIRQTLALLAGVSFPALAGLGPAANLLRLHQAGGDRESLATGKSVKSAVTGVPAAGKGPGVKSSWPGWPGWRAILKALGAFWAAALVSLAGALLVAGLLSDVSFMLKVNQFVGVKALHVLPVALVFFYILWQITAPSEGGRPVTPRRFWRAMVSMLRRPVTFEFLAWTALAGLIGLIYVLRTGNDSGLPIPGLETRFRGLLEAFLGVRPRTKEFLIGHPAFILAVYLAARGAVARGGVDGHDEQAARPGARRLFWVAWPLLLAGVIGQLSMVNTFSHIHTPLAVSVARTALALVFGSIIGILAMALVEIAAASGFGRRPGRAGAGDDGSGRG
ncbi:MAG: DUF5693 family protein [Firmicutes bacterium]|nr:DUF5693 family protein [Bacillota bacterium]